MHNVIVSFSLAFAFFFLARSGDLAISSAIAHSVIRAVFYGIAFVWLLLIFVLAIFGFISIPG